MEAKEFQKHLKENLIPFWNRLKDDTYGGFYGFVDENQKIDCKSVKGVILMSRILWFYSKAYMLCEDDELLKMANHVYAFLAEYCYDKQYGGMYWSVNYDGTPADTTKHAYNQAFAVYALSVYYQAGGNHDALSLAYTLYHLIEEKCRDRDGYLEAFHRDFTPASNEKLSENGVMAGRTMNTLLHVLEAYTELYRADGLGEVGDILRWIFRLFREKMFNEDKQILDVFFDKEYNSLIDLESYGHDIEASWLIDRGCQVLGDKGWQDKMEPIIRALVHTTYQNAYDKTVHALYNEREADQIDRQKIWWVQAEAVVGFYNAYQKDLERIEYRHAAEGIWHFIRENMVDAGSGEWYESIRADGTRDMGQALVHSWKCPYHNGRMCMEMIERLGR